MPLPEFTDSGELPPGVHSADLSEILTRFGSGHPQRVAVSERLKRIFSIVAATGHLRRFVVFGSFVTDKPAPNDVDILLVMEDSFDGSSDGFRPRSRRRSLWSQHLLGTEACRFWWRAVLGRILAGQTRRRQTRNHRDFWAYRMIHDDQELDATMERIRFFQAQLAHLRKTESNPANYRLSSSGFLAEVDRMQLEVREYLSRLPSPTETPV